LLHDAGPLDAIVTPLGGGGLFAGCCIAAHGLDADIEMWGVEPQAGNDVQQSFERGERVTIGVPKTIADGLQTQSPGEVTFAIIREHAKGVVTVTDEELVDAMRLLFERMKIVVEPSGAAAFAAVLNERFPIRGKRVGIVLSGGNVDPARYAELLS
jgi:threonine dehydratase